MGRGGRTTYGPPFNANWTQALPPPPSHLNSVNYSGSHFFTLSNTFSTNKRRYAADHSSIRKLTFTTCESTGEYVRQDTILGIVAKGCGLDERGADEPPVPCLVCDGRGLVHKGMECPECGGWGIVFKELGRGGRRGRP